MYTNNYNYKLSVSLINVYTHAHTLTFTHTHSHTYNYALTPIYTHIHKLIHSLIHTHTHTLIHTQTRIPVPASRWFGTTPCRIAGNFVHPMPPAHSNPKWPAWKGRPTTPACKALNSHGLQFPAASKESMRKEILVNQDYVQVVLTSSGATRAVE